MFSILIPSWNNLEYLQLCVNSIRRHSMHDHEILVHVNDGSDGTLDWVRQQGLRYSHSQGNVGICLAVNQLAGMAANAWLVYLNDDMVCCPGWDAALVRAIDQQQNDLIYLSVTVIEPTPSINPIMIVQNFGTTASTFDEPSLLANFMRDARGDSIGQASPVSVVSKRWWQMVGGYSLEFSPGMGSEDDLMMKFWIAGCRYFAVVGASRVYHFACRSTGRVRRNRGARTFVTKWGLTQGEFKRRYMARGMATADAFASGSDSMPRPTVMGRIKRALYGLSGNFPLGDIRAWDAAPGLHFDPEQDAENRPSASPLRT